MARRPPRWLGWLPAATIVAAAIGLVTLPGAPSSGHGAPAIPADGTVYTGATTEDAGADLNAFLAASGQRSVGIYQHFTAQLGPLGDILHECRSRGLACLVSWGLLAEDAGAPGGTLAGIAAGEIDRYLFEQLAAVRAFEGPVFLRPDWEMNAYWMPWSAYDEEGRPRPGNSAADYRRAWQRLRALMTGGLPEQIDARLARLGLPGVKAGAPSGAPPTTNAVLVWSPNLGPVQPEVGGARVADWYPGDDQVDWVALSVYAFGSASFAERVAQPEGLDDFYLEYCLNRAKPLMFAEWGLWDAASGGSGDDPRWLGDAFDWMEAHPQLKAEIYFEINATDGDHRLPSFPESLPVFRRRIAQARFLTEQPPTVTKPAD